MSELAGMISAMMYADGEDAATSSENLNWENPDARKIEALDEQIRQHPGHRLQLRLSELNRVMEAWVGFSMSLSSLLKKCEGDDEFISELMRNVGDRSRQDWIIRSLDQTIIAYVAALGALIDHTRSLMKLQPKILSDEYDTRTAELMKRHPAAPFLGRLRNYILHRVAAPWEFDGNFVGGNMTARVLLSSEALLEDRKGWTGDAKAFILASGEQVHLSPLLQPYLEAMVEHIVQVFPAVARANAVSIEDCDRLVKERNLLLSGGVTDGSDWEQRVAHMQENSQRRQRGEPQTDFRTGLPINRESEGE
ncbi:hypothetical protein ACH0AH_07555 [Microbacterium paludicola]|uniref:Uncharacterized protein n=1 Tax=Microbacterium paludicola TaxID=300019 RepID=A0A4Y9FWJ5_9MICO|nr:hypothetical protein [Microbacterium paludicola]MBF0816052.1 hypothetical protein [Microbacterium paludicola]TFU33240.1 hypothetical protein E4U02_06490 [Microbacterium paludicola]